MNAQQTIRRIEHMINSEANVDNTVDEILLLVCHEDTEKYNKIAAILGDRIHHNIVPQQLHLIFDNENKAPDAKIGAVLYILADGDVHKYNEIIRILAS